MIQDIEVRQPLPKTNKCCYREDLFIQPDKSMTTLNSDNVNSSVELVDPNDEGRRYSNHALTGTAHPRTKIAPIIPVRPIDTGGPTNTVYWRDDPMSGLSIMNKRRKQYPGLAGYTISELTARDYLKYPDFRNPLGDNIRASPLVQTIQPGVYTLPTTYDPINTDFNIDETTEFEPVKQNYEWGNVVFTPISSNAPQPSQIKPQQAQSQPQQAQSQPQQAQSQLSRKVVENYMPERSSKNVNSTSRYQNQPELKDDVSIYNVFDPRFSGYGSDNRSYLEPMLKQTRYYYDDINAIRMPNYIVRSKIDNCVTGFGDQYGPMRVDQRTLDENRPLAEQAYLDNNLAYRNDLMESLMRKRNSEIWQTRQAPKYTNRQGLK
jgi:hypothetical protein